MTSAGGKTDIVCAVVVVAATASEDHHPHGQCSPLIPLVDRPFLQHVVEGLIDGGIKRIEFLVSGPADQIESHFEDGSRWGAKFEYRDVSELRSPYAPIRI